jgi:sugar phosphate isomerase/epimerase
MRLGVSGVIVPHRVDEVEARHVAAVRAAGFSGFATRFWDHPGTVTPARARRVRDLFAAGGVTITQATGYWQPLIHPEPPARAAAVATLREAIRLAADLGARAVLTGPGTLNPRAAALPDDQRRWGAWWPDRANHGPAAIDRLVASLREALPAAETHGVLISLECHVLSTLESPEVARQVVEAVGSPLVTINIDPVNFVDTVPRYWANAGRLNEIYDLLDPYIVSGDAKDILLDDPVVVHLKEMPAGDGALDWPTALRRFERACPDGFLHLEHFPLDAALRGQRFIRQQAAALGIAIRE